MRRGRGEDARVGRWVRLVAERSLSDDERSWRQLLERRSRPTRMLLRLVLGAAAVVLGFLGGAHAHQLVAASDAPERTERAIDPRAHADEAALEDCPLVVPRAPYPVNENGLTYGSGAAVDEDDPGPDLVAAYGTNGRCGFVRASDRGQADRDVPLYAEDGVTVIGEVRVVPGRTLTSRAPEPSRSSP